MVSWKSTAAFSGATLLAGWFGWTSTPSAPPGAPRTTRAVPRDAGSDIQEQAARLGSRLRADSHFQAPARNPFRFDAGRPSPSRPLVASQPAVDVAPLAETPAVPTLVLAGIAEQVVDGVTRRTAILETNDGVALVREGELVAGYTVTRIDAGAAELTAADGTPRRLILAP